MPKPGIDVNAKSVSDDRCLIGFSDLVFTGLFMRVFLPSGSTLYSRSFVKSGILKGTNESLLGSLLRRHQIMTFNPSRQNKET